MGQKSALLSLNQAAKQVGKSPSVIHRAIKNGRLSVVSKEGNSYQIDPSELSRVFPWNSTQEQMEHSRTASGTGRIAKQNAPQRVTEGEKITTDIFELKAEIRVLEEVIKLRDEKVAIHERRCEEWGEERTRLIEAADQWRNQAERLLLGHQPETSSAFNITTTQTETEDGLETPVRNLKHLGWQILQKVAYLGLSLLLAIGFIWLIHIVADYMAVQTM